MKTIIINMILLSFLGSCSAKIKVAEMEKQRAVKSDLKHFFACMTSNDYREKIAKNNYYIFDTIEGYLYFGKVHSGFFRGKITEIYKIDIDILQKQLPNFKKLHGFTLKDIVLFDISKKNKALNKSEIIVKNIFYQLDNVIIISIDFEISGLQQQKVYRLNTTDFSIID